MSGPHPAVFVAGFPKCGSTSLFDWLVAHPELARPSVKEPHYYIDPAMPLKRNPPGLPTAPNDPIEDYLALWGDAPGLRVDGTPFSLYYPQAVEAIAESTDTRCVLAVIRRPADRILSLFRYAQHNSAVVGASLSFGDFVDRIRANDPAFAHTRQLALAFEHSDYVPYLGRARDRLGGRLRVVRFEDLADPLSLCQSVADDIGIDRSFYEGYDFPIGNPTRVVRSQAIQRLRRRLVRDTIQRGSSLRRLGRHIYDVVNTTETPPNRDDPTVPETLRSIDEQMTPAVNRLAADFGLDLDHWVEPRD